MSRVRSITKKPIKNKSLWNLAVEGDESYVANGIVVHNCRSVLVPITKFEDFEATDKIGNQSVDDFIAENKGAGFSKQ